MQSPLVVEVLVGQVPLEVVMVAIQYFQLLPLLEVVGVVLKEKMVDQEVVIVLHHQPQKEQEILHQ